MGTTDKRLEIPGIPMRIAGKPFYPDTPKKYD
jgi:hypothetical protein